MHHYRQSNHTSNSQSYFCNLISYSANWNVMGGGGRNCKFTHEMGGCNQELGPDLLANPTQSQIHCPGFMVLNIALNSSPVFNSISCHAFDDHRPELDSFDFVPCFIHPTPSRNQCRMPGGFKWNLTGLNHSVNSSRSDSRPISYRLFITSELFISLEIIGRYLIIRAR